MDINGMKRNWLGDQLVNVVEDMEIDDLFSSSEIIKWIQDNCTPQEVFDRSSLLDWAKNFLDPEDLTS